MKQTKNNLESALRLFCIENKDNIVSCDWYGKPFCMKTCKFYKNMEMGKTGQRLESFYKEDMQDF